MADGLSGRGWEGAKSEAGGGSGCDLRISVRGTKPVDLGDEKAGFVGSARGGGGGAGSEGSGAKLSAESKARIPAWPVKVTGTYVYLRIQLDAQA